MDEFFKLIGGNPSNAVIVAAALVFVFKEPVMILFRKATGSNGTSSLYGLMLNVSKDVGKISAKVDEIPGIRKAVHDLRDQLHSTALAGARATADIENIKDRLDDRHGMVAK
jgi:hypothetical protein